MMDRLRELERQWVAAILAGDFPAIREIEKALAATLVQLLSAIQKQKEEAAA